MGPKKAVEGSVTGGDDLEMDPVTTAAMELGLDAVRASPVGVGVVDLIVARPGVDARATLDEGVLDPLVGLVGDSWGARASRRTSDGSPHPEMQITMMNSRATALVAGPRERWGLAGDQLYVDLDLSEASLPAGSLLEIGTAVVEVSAVPHAGCAKFAERFGVEALRFVNSPIGRALRLRGLNARVVHGGVVRPGDTVRRVVPGP